MALFKDDVEVNGHWFCSIKYSVPSKSFSPQTFLSPFLKLQPNHYCLLTQCVPNAPFLYLLKTSENRKLFWCFQGVVKGCIGNKWVNGMKLSIIFCSLFAVVTNIYWWLYTDDYTMIIHRMKYGQDREQ